MSGPYDENVQAVTPTEDSMARLVPSAEDSTSELRLEIVISRYRRIMRELAATQDQLKAEQQNNARLLSALTRLQGESAAYRTLLDAHYSATDDTGEVSPRLDAMSAHMSTLVTQLSALSARMEAVGSGVERSQSAELVSACQRAQLAAQHSAESLHLVTTSLAWRSTAPFRKLRGFLLKSLGI